MRARVVHLPAIAAIAAWTLLACTVGGAGSSSGPRLRDDGDPPGTPGKAPDDDPAPPASPGVRDAGMPGLPPTLPDDDAKDAGAGAPPGLPSTPTLVPPGGSCACDGDCRGDATHAGLCIHGICGTHASSDSCRAGSASECPAGQRCWSGTGLGICYPDFVAGQCAGQQDSDGSCVSSGDDCYASCGRLCDRPGTPPSAPTTPPPAPPPSSPDAGSAPPPAPPGGDALGTCTGTAEECESARIINEYRAGHTHAGECSTPLRWDANLGRLAHEHQSGPFVRHSSHGYVENVGQAYGLRETTEYIVMWEAGIEEHCGPDGSYTVSHHCAAMFCNNRTVGVGVYQQGDATYITMMFGDESGQPSW